MSQISLVDATSADTSTCTAAQGSGGAGCTRPTFLPSQELQLMFS